MKRGAVAGALLAVAVIGVALFVRRRAEPTIEPTTEAFWSDASLVVRRPVDQRLRGELQRVFTGATEELARWPQRTYDAIDLVAWLAAHPELGAGDFVEITNARGEQLVVTRADLDRDRPLLVVGLDEERNMFRVAVTYETKRAYSWKDDPEGPARPELVRHVGGFLLYASAEHAVTPAQFALAPSSFRVLGADPLARVRGTAALEEGCLACHATRGAGARAHHVRAADGKHVGGWALALEDYPADVLRRFLFEPDDVALTFGVMPIRVERARAEKMISEIPSRR